MSKRSSSRPASKSGGGSRARSSAPRRSRARKDSAWSLAGFILILAAVLFAQYVLGIDVVPGAEEEATSEPRPQNVAPVQETVVAGQWYTVYFTEPINTNDRSRQTGAAIEGGMVAAINSAQRTLDGALFEINLQPVTDALIAAHRRGVQVRLVLDDDHAINDEDSTASQLKQAGIPIRSDNRSAFMHNKFLVIDGAAVWMGSTNFTRNDVYNNNNNSLFIRSTKLAENYTAEFNQMFVEGIFNREDARSVTPNRQISLGGTIVETYFSPEDGRTIESRLVELVNQARTSVRVMAFSFTVEELGQAMINRFQAGVDVKAIFESRSSLTASSQLRPLACANVPVKQDGNPNTFHHKVIIIDNQIVVVGSFNFSKNAIENNSENLLVIHDPQLAQLYTAEFDKRYQDQRAAVPTSAELNCQGL